MRRPALSLLLSMAALTSLPASADTIKVLTAGAFKQVAVAIIPGFEARTGHKVEVQNDTAGALAKRVADGERFDVLVLPPGGMQPLAASGRVVATSVVPLAKVGIGVAVKDGAPLPAIDTVEHFRQALLDARKVAMIDPASGGSSGIYLEGLFKQWGIADTIRAKAVLVPGGLVAERLVNGEADLAIHQVSEILPVKGARLVGPLPEAIQNYTVYAGALASNASAPAAAAEFLLALGSDDTARVLKDKGMLPGQSRIVMGIETDMASFSGDEENLGFRLAFKEANAAGGVRGRTITWTGYPRKGNTADQIAANARRMAEADDVFALVNMGGPLAIEAAKIAEERHVPLLFPHTGLITSTGKRYVFTSFPGYEGEARLMFKYLPQQRGLRKLGIVHDENVYGQLFLTQLKNLAGANGYEVVGNEPVHTRNPTDLRPELQRLAAAGAEGIVMALYPAQAKVLMNAKKDEAWKGRMISVGPLTDEEYLVLPGGVAEGTLGFCYYPDPNGSAAPGIVRYRKAMEQFEAGHPMNRYSLYGYTFGRIVVDGLDKAGPDPTRERFVDAMEGISNWDAGGVMPAVSFSRANHHAQFAGFICELKQGKFEALSDWVVP